MSWKRGRHLDPHPMIFLGAILYTYYSSPMKCRAVNRYKESPLKKSLPTSLAPTPPTYKDGLHIIIPTVVTKPSFQHYLRYTTMKNICNDILHDCHFLNKYEDIYDSRHFLKRYSLNMFFYYF